MRNITQILKYGQNSFSKARRVKTSARRKVADYFAFTVKSSRADGPRYAVRIAKEGRNILGECINLATGELCQGFQHTGHCYHLAKALLLAGK
jgi:hypothetical protein